MERVSGLEMQDSSSDSITAINRISENKSLVATEIPVREWENKSFLYAFSMVYTMAYLVLFIWLLFDGWLNQFQSIWGLWQSDHETVPRFVLNYLYLMIGAVFASGIVNVLILQQWAKQLRFDMGYWNGLFSPLLAAVIAVMVYALLQGLLMIFSGKAVLHYSSEISRLGFLCVGFVSAWYFLLQIGNAKLSDRGADAGHDTSASDPVEPVTEHPARESRVIQQAHMFRGGSMKRLNSSFSAAGSARKSPF